MAQGGGGRGGSGGSEVAVSPWATVRYDGLVSHEEAVAILLKRRASVSHCRVDLVTGCWVALMALQWSRPVVYSSRGAAGKRVTMGLHRLAFIVWHGRDVLEGCVVSHLCNNQLCFCPSHMAEETRGGNVQRGQVGCAGVIVCRGCDRVLCYLCKHSPPCMVVQQVDCCRVSGTVGEVSDR
jgi:hypothetical protein